MAYYDIDPQDIDPDTNRPYANYSSPCLDTSFHDHEMNVDDDEGEVTIKKVRAVTAPGFPVCYEFYVYQGDQLIRVCPSIGMAQEVAAGLL